MTEIFNPQKLGFGMMRLPVHEDGSINLELLYRLVDRFLDAGFTYFDTAYVYHDGDSERAIRHALMERYPRKRFTLATKMPHNFLKRGEDVDATFEEQLDRTGVDYFDFYLMHGVNNRNWERYERFGCWEHAARMKRRGLVNHLGFSFHGTPELLEQLLNNHPETEFVQLQINYVDWESPRICSRECYEIVRRHGLPVTVMEPVKGGMLANLPEDAANILHSAAPEASQASWALRYAAGLEGVKVVLSGMNAIEQLEDNIATLRELKPLMDTERKTLACAAASLLAVPTEPCTGCRYCVKGCPAGLEIPALIGALNNCRLFHNTPSSKNQWEQATQKGAVPARCIGCRQCESACPQHLPIVSILRELKEAF